MEMTRILLGAGDWIVAGVGTDNFEGIGFYRAPEHGHEIDSAVPLDVPELQTQPECAILVTDLKAARLLQDQVALLVLRLNGYKVANRE